MCEALLRGLLKAGVTNEAAVTISEPFEPRREYLKKEFGPSMTITEKNAEVVSRSAGGLVVIAVKPQYLKVALQGLPKVDVLFVSIVAGATLEQLSSYTSPSAAIVRVMPNTPALVGEGAGAFCVGVSAEKWKSKEGLSAQELVAKVLGCVCGETVCCPESHLDAVTGLSGSGPAFFYLMIEAMADAAVKEGLPRDQALRLAAQTCAGAGKMVSVTGKHPGVLKDAVTSPAGTTIAGVAALEEHGLRKAAMKAVEAAAKRSRELARL